LLHRNIDFAQRELDPSRLTDDRNRRRVIEQIQRI
jgi:hypothetical protein